MHIRDSFENALARIPSFFNEESNPIFKKPDPSKKKLNQKDINADYLVLNIPMPVRT